MNRTLSAMLTLFALSFTPSVASAEPDCATFISALKGIHSMDSDGQALFTKICKRNSDDAIKAATTCLEKGKTGGNATLDRCLKPLK